MNDNNFNRRNRKQRDTSPTAVASIPKSGFDVLVYRGIDSKTNRAVFHWKIARRNRNGDGYYATNRVDGIGGIVDMVFALEFVCAKFALVEELDDALRAELREFAKRLGSMIVDMALSDAGNEAAEAKQRPNGLASAFGVA